jgi:hypothetical protein
MVAPCGIAAARGWIQWDRHCVRLGRGAGEVLAFEQGLEGEDLSAVSGLLSGARPPGLSPEYERRNAQ